LLFSSYIVYSCSGVYRISIGWGQGIDGTTVDKKLRHLCASGQLQAQQAWSCGSRRQKKLRAIYYNPYPQFYTRL